MRTLTIVVQMDKTEDAKWIWTSHKTGKTINGVKVGTIAEGDEIGRLDERVNELLDKLGDGY